MHKINTVAGTPVTTGSRTRPISPIHAVRINQSCLPQDNGFNRKFLHGPNRKVPSYIQQGQQVYTGSVPLWLQHHPWRTSKTRSGFDLRTAYQKLHSLLTNRVLKPILYILDNECPIVLKNFMREVNDKFQFVPPHIHRRNSAEQVIWTFKDHFISGLASTHK